MQSTTMSELLLALGQASQQFFRLAHQFLSSAMQLPLPALLMACLGAALVLSILPLAVGLFVGFLLIKLVVSLFMLKPEKPSNQ